MGVRNCFIMAMLVSTHLNAASMYLGMESQLYHQKFRSGYGDNLFKKATFSNAHFIGVDFDSKFGAEVGYEHFSLNPHTSVLRTGDLVAGIPVPKVISPVIMESGGSISGPYVRFMFYQTLEKADPKFQLVYSIGASRTNFNLYRTTRFIVGSVPAPGRRNFKRKKDSLRLGAGIQYSLDDHLKIRGMVFSHRIGGCNLKQNDFYLLKVSPMVRLKNSITYSAALIWMW